MFHQWPRICSVCHNHNPILPAFMTYHWVCKKSNTTGATCGAGIAYPSGAPEFTPYISGVRIARSLIFCVVFYRSLFVYLWFFYWSLYCTSVLDLRLLITPFVSSNFSYFSPLNILWIHLRFTYLSKNEKHKNTTLSGMLPDPIEKS